MEIMESYELQKLFFQQLKSRLPQHLSMAEEVADLLGISTDSSYRRIRGEKAINLDELQKLCRHYRLSLDHIMNIDTNSTVFYGNWVDAVNFDFKKYLQDWLTNLNMIGSATTKMFYYDAKDIPLYHHYQFPDLSKFKFFFWMRTILSYPDYLNKSYEDMEQDEELHQTGMQILKSYNRIPSVEIWTLETINSTLRQIEFYHESGVFRKKENVALLYDQLEQLVFHVKEQAECGEKFLMGDKPAGNENNFRLFFNEVSTGHNTVMADTDGMLTVYLNHGVMNYMITRDKHFCEFTKKSLENTMRKSSLISSVSEKERSKFFQALRKKITDSRNSM